jgi:hypothetical protein
MIKYMQLGFRKETMLELSSLKSSTVLSAMVTGLLKAKNDSRFTVEMASFGHVENNLCYGCAATLALAEMYGKGQLISDMMLAYAKTQADQPSAFVYARLSDVCTHLSDVLSLDPSSTQDFLSINELYDLENAVDKARTGRISWLIKFLTGEENTSFDKRWILETDNWEEQLPKVEATIAEMAAAGY